MRRWPFVNLGDLCSPDRTIVPSGTGNEASLPYLGLEHLEADTGLILKNSNQLRDQEGISATFLFDSRHVLYGKLRPYLNKVALPDFTGRCTTEIIPLLPKPPTNREYLAWLLRRPETTHWAMKQNTGSRMPRADVRSLLSLEVPVPPAEEQVRIASALNEQMAVVWTARQMAKERLAAGEAVVDAYIREVFERSAAEHWQPKLLGDMSETCSGATPSRGRPDYYGGRIPWVKTGELKDGVVGASGSTEEMVTELAVRECSLPRLPVGTLLVAMYGQGQTRGRTGLLACNATTNQACFAILPNHLLFDSTLLQFWFRANYYRLRALTENRGGNQPNLNGVLLRQLQIALPPIEQQAALAVELANRCEAAKSIVTKCREELVAIEAIPASLLRAAFDGNS